MRLTRWLETAHPFAFSLFAGTAAFSTYFSMYAFRKPFTAATFEDVQGWDFALDYKVALVIAQVVGYALSKVIGVKVISEMDHSRRAVAIIALIGVSWLALVGFALCPAPWNVAALFMNGLPLGLIWGLVFSYVEGRRTSEVLGALLCASFILSSGVVKSVGKALLNHGVSDLWMPAAAGLVFVPLLVISVTGMSLIPPPNAADEAARVRRGPMDRPARTAFLKDYGPGVILLVAAYVLFTAVRDLRDNFAAEIWSALGFGGTAAIFTASELPVAAIALCALGAIMIVRDNLRALLVIHGIVILGAAVLGGATLGFQLGMISPIAWMILSGAGLYMAYTPFNAMLFDRMIAATGRVGTAGFLIYLADASGYVGSVALLLFRNFGVADMDWLNFFVWTCYAAAAVSVGLVAISAVFFAGRRRMRGRAGEPAATITGQG
jgi:hypothetical protein